MLIYFFRIIFCLSGFRKGLNGLFLVFIGLGLWQCAEPEEVREFRLEKINAPLSNNVFFPYLKEDAQNRIWMTWMWENQDSSALQFAYWADSTWWDVKTLRTGKDWFVNWADFPGVFRHSNGSLATYILTKSNPDTYAYDISLSVSWDEGNSWINGIIPHKDETDTEHGFLSFFEYNPQKTGMVWLDGRNYVRKNPEEQTTSLRFATIDQLGHVADNQELDSDICTCCQTDAVEIPGGAIVVYRDRRPEEIRDISYVRLQNGTWTNPRSLSSDNWQIAGCPVNGPAVDAAEDKVAVVWFTAPEGEAKVKWAYSNDAGDTFSESIIVDHMKPIGRVDLKIVQDEVWISWIGIEKGDTKVLLARYDWLGQLIEKHSIGTIAPDRSSGFPRMAHDGQTTLIGWTKPGPKKDELELYKIDY